MVWLPLFTVIICFHGSPGSDGDLTIGIAWDCEVQNPEEDLVGYVVCCCHGVWVYS